MVNSPYIVVVGCSAGGLTALKSLFANLTLGFPAPIVLVQHRGRDNDLLFESVLQPYSVCPVVTAVDKGEIRAGHIYVAPADYHLFIEERGRLALSQDQRINFSRPSIDVLFESAAEAYGQDVYAVVLSGANEDGARGSSAIAKLGGKVYVQAPGSANVATMPMATLQAVPDCRVGLTQDIFPHIASEIEACL